MAKVKGRGAAKLDTPVSQGSADGVAIPAPSARSKGRRGAPAGNLNRLAGDPRGQEMALLARLGKQKQKQARDQIRLEAEAEASAILEELDLADHALARRIGKRLADIETEIARLRVLVDGPHGRFTSERTETPAYARLMSLVSTDRAELMKALDRLAEVTGARPVDNSQTRYVVSFDDGSLAFVNPEDREFYARCAADGEPIRVTDYVCPTPTTWIDGRPAAPGDAPPLDVDPDLGRTPHEAAGDDALAGEGDSLPAASGRVLGARGAAAQLSVDRKIGRHIRNQSPQEAKQPPARRGRGRDWPPAVPDGAEEVEAPEGYRTWTWGGGNKHTVWVGTEQPDDRWERGGSVPGMRSGRLD